MIQNKLIGLIAVILSTAFISFSGEQILHKPYTERQLYFLENFYNNTIHGDSLRFFKKVNELKNLAIKHKDRELYLETVYMRLNFLSARKYKNYIHEIKELIKIADDENLLYLQIRTRQALGFHYYYEYQDYSNAILYFLQSAEYLYKINEKDFPEKQEALLNLANICYHAGYENKALRFIKEAKKNHYQKYARHYILNILNTEALIYQNFGDVKKSEQIFKEIIDGAARQKNIEWELIASNNLSELYYDRKLYDNALHTLNQTADFDTIKYKNHHIFRTLLYAKCYLATQNMEAFVKNARYILNNVHFPEEPLTNQYTASLILCRYFDYKGDVHQAFQYADSVIKLQIKLNNILHTNAIKKAVEKENYRQYRQKEEALKLEKKHSLQTAMIFLSACLLIIGSLITYYVKNKKRHQRELMLKQKKLLQKEEELENARAYLQQFIADSKRKDTIINQLSKEITGEHKKSLLDMLILTDDDWVLFKKEFTAVYPDFFGTLKQIFPKITPAIERLAALLFIGLDNSQIANMLGIGKDSVSRSKRRLKEQLQIPPDTDFISWFESKTKII